MPVEWAQRSNVGKTLRGASLCVMLSVAWLVPGSQAQAQQYQFNTVVIDGNERIGDSAILRRAGIGRGQAVTGGQLNDAYQNLQNSGLFQSISLEPQGGTLVITVVELPTLNRVSFEGNRRIKDEMLAELIGSTERRVFNPSQAEQDAAAIAEAYSNEGRLSARVQPRIIRRGQNRVDLVFEIFEGDNVEIERLSFVGNRVYSDRRLRRVLGTKQAGLFRRLVKRDTYVEGRVEADKQLLRDFYLSRGYVDMRTEAVNAELTEERDGVFVAYNITEGQQFRFGEVTLETEVPGLNAAAYRDLLKIRPGVIYSPTLIENDIARIERQAIRDGVDFLRVEPVIDRNDRDLSLNVTYKLSRGERIFVERIDIEGNTTTLDRVIRREFDSVEGDPFNPREIRQAAERIRALQYFETAEVNARQGSSPEQVVIDVDVEEQPTGSLNFGGSFSNNDGFGVAVSFQEENFLGRGQRLNLSISTAEDATRYGVTFVEPRFLGRDVALGLKLDYAETNSSYTSYDTERLVFQPSLTFPVSENGRLSTRYTLEGIEMLERDDEDNSATIANEIAEGALFSSSVGYTYTYDTRRSGLDPTQGVLFEFGQDFAGLGGDNEYIKTTAKVAGEKRIFNEEVTLRATLEGGALTWNSGTNRAVDRFILGPSIMRGFEPGGIGPRDQSNGVDDALGGNLFAVARFEAEFPLGLPEEYGITGGVFYDVGNLWDLSDVDTSGGTIVGESGSFRHVIGVSVFWDTPLGPLQFNVSDALKKESFDKEQSFEVTLRTTF
ncbi:MULTISPECIES: outer membrane protein assembly factor BamA [unclassified Sulfitobacter]|uniref:outer membrane protein assembly factor BamA n=1 Tax=unclassified Sulfitobacter TaxID=196795 RepID=UPI0023E14BF9|nr:MULTISPECIES: outer membrane protein assembly factor BamA [unclassified Sulfitobacter]MDF3383631.1 outer membrane protein assembly factor BamA [Sulfitobacter sp. Ks11]MDF3387049.1 outer membrane protein assembly factor BamA [Sulfitobacter sp. M85]MDF3390469.1 outer membrane protein assembly factor BamA [Sulfitobacter sp. Ks16]MDF3401106.1 outer membrane protein assembly factor BamA [Sulfitobacter sp. KE39]MDF3404527.1 outer membrane protein assembly factor BamA [Sulfitobacter sp. Ks35]